MAVLSSLIFVAVPTQTRFDRKLALPTAARIIALIVLMASTVIFAVFGYITATSHNVPPSRVALLAFYHAFPEGNYLFGVFGLAFFISASLCLMAYLLNRGSLRALKDTMRFFVLPALIIFELFLLFADTHEMPIRVTMFLASTPISDILTNWVIFVVSSGLFVIALAHRKLGI